jgi:hypothetical protein
MNRYEKIALVAVAAALAISASALASETVTYSYDSRGRLVKVARSGSVNNNVATNYSYDKADSRILKNVTGAP